MKMETHLQLAHVILLSIFTLCRIFPYGASQLTCRSGYYNDDQSFECLPCRRCAYRALDIYADSGIPRIHKCVTEMLCPFWCADESSDDTTEICKEYDYKPFANITGNATYDSLTRTYTLTCTFYTHDNGIPAVEIRNSSSYLVASKANFRHQHGELSVLIPVLQKEDQGSYECSVVGNTESAKTTTYLKYEEPTTTSPTTEPTTQSTIRVTTDGSKTTKDGGGTGESTGPLGGQAVLVVAVVLGATFVTVLCGILAAVFIWKRYSRSRSGRRDYESACPMIEQVQSLRLESLDFRTFTITGLESLWNCDSSLSTEVKLKKKKKTIRTVTLTGSHSDPVEISGIKWRDSISVWTRSDGRRFRHVTDLKVNCLVVPKSEIQMTSAVIHCPPEDIFFMKLAEEKDDSSVHWLSSSAEEISGGRKQLRDLRPAKTYHVELGTKDHHGHYRGQWKHSFKTKVPKVSAVPRDKSARLTLSFIVSDNPPIYVQVNRQDPTRVEGQEVNVSGLLPGCKQIVHLEVKEDGVYRVLSKEEFTTSGDQPLLGDYEGDVTTEFPGDPTDSPPTPRPADRSQRRATRDRRRGAKTCNTSLREALDEFRGDCKDPPTLNLMVACLQDLFRVHYPKEPAHSPTVKRSDGLGQIMLLLRQYDLLDVCGIFPVLKKFVDFEGTRSSPCLEFARKLNEAHQHGPCDLCTHMLFLLEYSNS